MDLQLFSIYNYASSFYLLYLNRKQEGLNFLMGSTIRFSYMIICGLNYSVSNAAYICFSFRIDVILCFKIFQIRSGLKGAWRYASYVSCCSEWIHCFIGLMLLALVHTTHTHTPRWILLFTLDEHMHLLYVSMHISSTYHTDFLLLIIPCNTICFEASW